MNYDVIVVGGGMVGLVAALSFAKLGKKIALIESKKPQLTGLHSLDPRVVALNHAAQTLLTELGLWPLLANQQQLSPYEKMVVWDSSGPGRIEFDAGKVSVQFLGHIVVNQAIVQTAFAAVMKNRQIDVFCPAEIQRYFVEDQFAKIELQDGQILSAALIIGADGANSWLREAAGIKLEKKSYGQAAVVAIIETEKKHEATAWQVFLPTGPLALLPLVSKNHCAMVWSHNNSDILLQSNPLEFDAVLNESFGSRLGFLKKISPLQAIPLFERQADTYVQPHLALVGDSAHTIHPLAGQGVNLGFQDIRCLMNAMSQGEFGSFKQLRQYARERRAENQKMILGMRAFHQVFTHQSPWIQTARRFLLNQANQMACVKNRFIAEALGIAS